MPSLHTLLTKVGAVNRSCLEAKVEENDHTVLTFDDLAYELELAEAGIRKKIAFVENQVGTADSWHVISDKLRWSPQPTRMLRRQSWKSLKRLSSILTRRIRMYAILWGLG